MIGLNPTLRPLVRKATPCIRDFLTTTISCTDKKRNPILAEVIREGLGHLNHQSNVIQQAKETQKPLITKPSESTCASGKEYSTPVTPLPPSVLAEQHRLLSVANECLEYITSQKESIPGQSSTSALSVHGEPIVLLECHVQKSLKQATIYWTLPINVWLLPFSWEQKFRLQEKIQEQMIIKNTGRQNDFSIASSMRRLQGCIRAKLSSYYAPKVHFEPATMDQIEEHLHFIFEEHDNDDDSEERSTDK